jgi:hypothetical protein
VEEEWKEQSGPYQGANKKLVQRTNKYLVLAAGLNNAFDSDDNLMDDDFRLAGSRFFEIGFVLRSQVFKESAWLRFNYGLSFQFNGLKPIDNRYFVHVVRETSLEEFEFDLDKSKFRLDNLVIPLHFEFGPYKKKEGKKQIWFSTKDKFRIGLGGYVGLNIGERQKLKYVDGLNDIKMTFRNDYNTQDFIYGLSGYIGIEWVSLYAKYDLNPIFKSPNQKLHNASLGLRFDLN